ncbi:monocarboxylate transporter 12-like [Acanthaster planci]|uniref:Monocarboxylate transporter 12-like n=1 Tax=Acanthaster planci TaxID=133434 RepID=A0A8B7ZEK2_ACAPL|nr:monocarboxylate transporter 12-like [Acanthaster planci]XP_022104083.1 monocarboxylate transporter 12-like [Acanthaster planci]
MVTHFSRQIFKMSARCSASYRQVGWFAVLCVHVEWLLWAGLIKSLGVLLPTLQEQLTADTWMIGGLIATITGAGSFAAPLSRPLEVLCGTRIVVTVCGFLLGASVIVSSFSTSAIQMTLALSLIAGPALMVINVLSRAMMGRYFTMKYAIANAIGTAGEPVGLITFAPLTQVLLETYGWRGALLLLGALCLHLGVCGLLLKRPPHEGPPGNYQSIISSENDPIVDETSSPDAEKKSLLRILRDVAKAQGNIFGCTVCSRTAFGIATLVYGSRLFVDSLWMIYFVAYAESKGFSGYEAVTFTTAAGIGNLAFKILIGVVVDQGWLKLRLGLLLSVINCGVALSTLPWMNSYWLMMVNALLFNGFIGGQASLGDIYTRELLGAEELVSAFGWMDLLSATIQIAFGFFPGWIYDQTGSYDVAFVILGFISLLPLASLFLEKLLN